ncbi:restriction endonuclease subunit S [Streptococcus salivarius]
MKLNSNNYTSRIRIKKNNNTWRKVRIAEIATVILGQSPDSKNYTDNPNDYILVQGNADMRNGRVVPRVWTSQVTKLAEKGDLILSVRAPVGDVGKTDYPVVLGRGVAAIKGNEFLFQLLTKMKQSHYWSKFSTGSTFESINSNDIKSAEIYLPSIEEQSAIGSFFRTLDDLLASYKNNLANYQSLKATMLSKMFPKAGEAVPEIRLDGFEREWKKFKLKDVAHRVQGNDGRMDLPTLTISASGGWMNQIDRFSANIAGKEQKNYTLLKKGELSYNHGNSKLAKYGVVFELQDYEEALVPKVYHSFRVNQLADAKFIEIMFSTKIPDRELGKLVSSGARMDGLLNISFDDFMNIAIIIPTIEEQQAIGSYFSNLDQLITSYQEKITQLETLKKKLLQDMFI